MKNSHNEPRDLWTYAASTNRRLVLGGLSLAVLVAVALIAWLYGWGAARMGLLCIGLGLMPVVLVGLILLGMDWFVRKVDRD
jgi:hypothetical protein